MSYHMKTFTSDGIEIAKPRTRRPTQRKERKASGGKAQGEERRHSTMKMECI